jgi:hypothetical protein
MESSPVPRYAEYSAYRRVIADPGPAERGLYRPFVGAPLRLWGVRPYDDPDDPGTAHVVAAGTGQVFVPGNLTTRAERHVNRVMAAAPELPIGDEADPRRTPEYQSWSNALARWCGLIAAMWSSATRAAIAADTRISRPDSLADLAAAEAAPPVTPTDRDHAPPSPPPPGTTPRAPHAPPPRAYLAFIAGSRAA